MSEDTRSGNQPDDRDVPAEATAPRTLHPVAWVIWLAAILIVLTSTRNPIYLGMILLFIALVRLVQRPARAAESGVPTVEISVWRFGLVVVSLSALINALMVHVGDHVLFTIPTWVPLLGGPVTLEAIVFGLLNGLLLTGLFAAFSVVNRVIPMRAALRLVPRAYYPVAVVTSIAVTFVGTTLREIQQIREAQAVRGHRMRGARSWLPVIVPLLEGGMERSLQLAEAMTARGFASTESNADARPQLLMLLGLLGLMAGWLLRLAWQQPISGNLLLMLSAALVIRRFLAGRTATSAHGLPAGSLAWPGLDCRGRRAACDRHRHSLAWV